MSGPVHSCCAVNMLWCGRCGRQDVAPSRRKSFVDCLCSGLQGSSHFNFGTRSLMSSPLPDPCGTPGTLRCPIACARCVAASMCTLRCREHFWRPRCRASDFDSIARRCCWRDLGCVGTSYRACTAVALHLRSGLPGSEHVWSGPFQVSRPLSAGPMPPRPSLPRSSYTLRLFSCSAFAAPDLLAYVELRHGGRCFEPHMHSVVLHSRQLSQGCTAGPISYSHARNVTWTSKQVSMSRHCGIRGYSQQCKFLFFIGESVARDVGEPQQLSQGRETFV